MKPTIRPAITAASAAFIFLAGGLVACSSEQPKPQNQAQQNQNVPQQSQQPGEQPGEQNGQQPGVAGDQNQVQGQQPGQAANVEIPAPREKLGIVSEVPSSSRIPTQKTVIARQNIPTITVTRVGADINRMSADDFKALGLTGDLAQSIIQYRNAHGPFKSVKDLGKIPHMDNGWLTDNQDQLAVSPNFGTG